MFGFCLFFGWVNDIMKSLYHAQEIFGGGKFWRTMQMKAIGKEKFGKQAAVSAYFIYVYHVSVNIGEENFGERLTIHQICQFSQFSLTKLFPCTVYTTF